MTREELEGALRSTPDPREREYRPRRLPKSLVAGPVRVVSSGDRSFPAFAIGLAGAVRPQPSGSKRRLLAMSVAAVPLTAMVVVAVLVLRALTAPPPAFAGWTAVPGPTDPAVAEIVEDECRQNLQHPADDPNFETMFDEEQRRKISAWPDPATLPLAAQDQRGDVALAFFTDGKVYAECTIQHSGGDGGYTAIGQGEIDGERTGVLRILGGVSAEGSSDGTPPLRSVIGDLAPAVASVIIEREAGEPVTATVRGGYFLAWWPSDADIVRITAYDEEGNVLGSI